MMRSKIRSIIRILVFFGIGVGIFWLIYRTQDWKTTFSAIIRSKYQWLIFSALLGLLSHISRSIRWRLLLEPLGYKPRLPILFFSVMIMYFTNLAVPRSGEFVRCSITSKYEKIPFSTLLGTVFTERIIDIIILLVLIIIAFISQFKVFIEFLDKHPQMQAKISSLLHSTPFILVGLVVLLFSFIFLYIKRDKIKKTSFYKRFEKIINQFISGIKSILSLQKKWAFILHSLFIWMMYFVMIYVSFKAFDFTSSLDLLSGLMVFVMASLGMVAPSPGGIGTWHFMVIETLFIYGINKDAGKIFAFAAHETQILMLITFGILSYLALFFVKPKQKSI